MITLRFLGNPEIERNGQRLATDRRKALALLAYLAVNDRPIRREMLAALLWPEADQAQAHAYLRRALFEAVRLVGEDHIVTSRETLVLPVHPELEIDVRRLAFMLKKPVPAGAERSTLFEELLRLYRGDFLAGFSLGDCPEFDEWQTIQAEFLRSQFAGFLDRLGRSWLTESQAQMALRAGQRWVELSPLDEAAYRLVMEAYAASGQRAAALRQYELCAARLREQLDLEPEPETRLLVQRIRAAKVPFAGQVKPDSAGRVDDRLERRPAAIRLPVPATPFIGRKAELAEIAFLLTHPHARLVTVFGSGGMGKTRLALQAASGLAASFRDGIYFIPLASLIGPDQVPARMAEVLQISFKTADPHSGLLQQLADYLRQRQVLLVMDNFEHLVDSAGILSLLLAEAPEVKILVTSRERLNLAEEYAFELGGMSYPADPLEKGPESYSSVQLFEHHARRVSPHFHPSEDDRLIIGRICRLLEGLPLGIELAAAWVRVLSPVEILDQIQENLDFLTSSQRGTPEKHRSLRAVFEHSWNLLSAADRAAYEKLAEFRGGFRLDAAVHVAGLRLDQLSSLVDKSLVHRLPDDRYELHELLRKFASEKLAGHPSVRKVLLDSYQEYYLNWLHQYSLLLAGPGQKEALNRLAPETANIQSAWYRLVLNGSLEEMESRVLEMLTFFEMRSRPKEALEIFGPALERVRREIAADPGDLSAKPILTLLLAAVGQYTAVLGRLSDSQILVEQSLDLALPLPPGRTRAYALVILGFGSWRRETTEVNRLYQESLAAFQDTGDVMGEALALQSYGVFRMGQLDFSGADESLKAALSLFERQENRWGMALCYHTLAEFASWSGNYRQSRQMAEQALEIYSDLDDPWRKMDLRFILGQVLTASGDYESARECFDEVYRFAVYMGNRYSQAVNLDCLCYLDNLQGNYSHAEQLAQESLSIYRQVKHNHGIGMAITNLGDAALGKGDLAAARGYYEQALGILSEFTMAWGKSKCLSQLGRISLLESDAPQAREQLKQALRTSANIHRAADTLAILESFAELHFHEGDEAAAHRLLDCIRADPAHTAETRRRVEQITERICGPQGRFAAENPGGAECARTLEDWIAFELAEGSSAD